ncbi:helix-turn-helix domain-containing protein [Phyllobacterium leguminum]|nr:helix-turn-helix transcriptional regulator [Phyllobacterium leguminum]
MTNSFHSESYAILLTVLIEARRDKGLTQQIVAERLRKPQSYVAKIEGGERRLDMVEFIALSQALEIKPDALFARILEAIEHLD